MTWPNAKTIRTVLIDATGIAAVASIAYGAWMIYQPAGFIVGGVIVLAGVLAAARSGG